MESYSFHKLDDGSWGIKVSCNLGGPSVAKSGAKVEVRKRDGSSKSIVLGSEVTAWNGRRAVVFTIERSGLQSEPDREQPRKRQALDLSDRATYLDVTECKYCHSEIAWATSKTTGKRYPCEVQPAQKHESDGYIGHDNENLRAAPWVPHTREACEKEKARRQELMAS